MLVMTLTSATSCFYLFYSKYAVTERERENMAEDCNSECLFSWEKEPNFAVIALDVEKSPLAVYLNTAPAASELLRRVSRNTAPAAPSAPAPKIAIF